MWYGGIDDLSIRTGYAISISESGINNDMLANIPSRYVLKQNYPNPFNPETTIRFELPEKSQISLNIYDITGKLIKTLVNGKKEAGYHLVIWNGKDEKGRDVTSGIYFYQIESKGFSQIKQCLLLK